MQKALQLEDLKVHIIYRLTDSFAARQVDRHLTALLTSRYSRNFLEYLTKSSIYSLKRNTECDL